MEYSVPVEAGPACFREPGTRFEGVPATRGPWSTASLPGTKAGCPQRRGQRVAAISVHQDARRPYGPLFDRVEPIFPSVWRPAPLG